MTAHLVTLLNRPKSDQVYILRRKISHKQVRLDIFYPLHVFRVLFVVL